MAKHAKKIPVCKIIVCTVCTAVMSKVSKITMAEIQIYVPVHPKHFDWIPSCKSKVLEQGRFTALKMD